MIPSVVAAIRRIHGQVQLKVVSRGVVDFEPQETEDNPVIFYGSLQPQRPQQILMKPEGQRTWKFWSLYTEKELALDWVIVDKMGKRYRVVGADDWRDAGYFRFDLTEAPAQGAS